MNPCASGLEKGASVGLFAAGVVGFGGGYSAGAKHLDDVVDASTPVGRKGVNYIVKDGTNAPAVINGRHYSGHSLDSMQERGLVPSVVEDTIANGEMTSSGGKKLYYSPYNNVSVVINNEGDVVTAANGKFKPKG